MRHTPHDTKTRRGANPGGPRETQKGGIVGKAWMKVELGGPCHSPSFSQIRPLLSAFESDRDAQMDGRSLLVQEWLERGRP